MISRFLLFVQLLLLAYLSWQTSVNRTEVGHVGAAVYFWQTGRFDVFAVNPPLTRILAGIPMTLASPNYDWKSYSPRPQDRSEWGIGSAFMRANDESYVRGSIFFSRMMLVPLILLGGWFGYKFADELYGPPSGLIFLTLWTFSPLILGWGATLCPDMAAAALGVVGITTFWRWIKSPTWWGAVVAGITLGLLPLTKMTWVIAFPLYIVLWGVMRIGRNASMLQPPLKQLAVILLVGIYVLNMGYGFDGTFRKLGDFTFHSGALTGHNVAESKARKAGNRFAESWLGAIPVPLPADFVQGIDTQKGDFERGLESYLNGEHSDRGWKSYFAYVLIYKEPIGGMVLFGLALGISTAGFFRCRKSDSLPCNTRDEWFVILPGVVIFFFISMQDGFSIHPRYILPVLPFAYLFAAKTGQFFTSRNRFGMSAVMISLAAVTISSLSQYPHSMSYFNAIAGGMKGGPSHLLGSNADWGQSNYFFCDWCRKNWDKTVRVGFLGKDEIERLGIENAEVWTSSLTSGTEGSKTLEAGYYALSVNEIFGRTKPATFFHAMEPIHRIGASVWIYHLPEPILGESDSPPKIPQSQQVPETSEVQEEP